MAAARLTHRVTIITVVIAAVALGTVFVAQPNSASAHHEPSACQEGLVLTPGSEEKDAIENTGDEKCYRLSGLEDGKIYTLVAEKVYVNHIHKVYFNGGGIVTGAHPAIVDSVLSLHDFTHYRCNWGSCPPDNKLLSSNHAPLGDPSAQIEFTTSGGEELYAIVKGFEGTTGGFKISLSYGFYRMAEQECGQIGSCLVSILDIDPCALGGCVSILSGTIDMNGSGQAAQSETVIVTNSAAAAANVVASDDAGTAEGTAVSGGAVPDVVGAADSTAATDIATVTGGAAAAESAVVAESAGATNTAGASVDAGVSESVAAAEDAVATESAAAAGNVSASGNVAATESSDADDSAVASDEPAQPSDTHRSDSTSQRDSGSQPEQPAQPSDETIAEVTSGDSEGGIVLVVAILAGLAVALAGCFAGVFAAWKMRWSGR